MPIWSAAAVLGMVLTALVAFTHTENCVLTPVRRFGTTVFQSQYGLQLLFITACLIHFVEAVWVVDLCVQHDELDQSPAWFTSTLLVGYASAGVLRHQLLHGIASSRHVSLVAKV